MSRIYPGIAPDDPLRPLLDSMAERDDAMDANVAALSDAIKGVSVLPADGLARLEQAAMRGVERKAGLIAKARNARTLLRLSLAIAGAFVVGWGGAMATGYATSSYAASGPAVLPGDAILCQASGVRLDPEGRKFYPALNVRLEASGRR